MAAKEVTASLVAENTFTDWINPKIPCKSEDAHVHFLNISVGGTWAGTITLQRRFGSTDANSPRDVTDGSFVHTTATVIEKSLYDHESGVQYRIGFKTGDYTSGTALVRLGA